MLIDTLCFFVGFFGIGFVLAMFDLRASSKRMKKYLNSWSETLDREFEALERNGRLLRYLNEIKARFPDQFASWAEDERKKQEEKKQNVC